MAAFSLDVETKPLARALGRVSTADKTVELIHLKYHWGVLRLSAGGTAVEVKATGSWPEVVSVQRASAQTLKQYLPDTPVTTLRVENGKLYARDFGLACVTGERIEENEDVARRQRDLNAAAAALASYRVTAQEMEELLDSADPETASLWGPNDGRLIEDIATAWKCLAARGVEPSAIRRLIDRKTRDLFKAPAQGPS
jgi:hypothetical protein